MSDHQKLSKNERLKESSLNLRGTLAEDLDNDAPYINTQNTNIAKFHGIYQRYQDLVPLDQLIETVTPLFEQFKEERQNGETFSDFVSRVGFENLKEVAA